MRRELEQQISGTEQFSDWSALGARIVELAAAATAVHLHERASLTQARLSEADDSIGDRLQAGVADGGERPWMGR